MGDARIVSIVDDDISVLQSLTSLLRSAGLGVRAYSCAEAFLETNDLATAGCLIVDLRMPGMSGFELQRLVGASGFRVPVIVVSGHGGGLARAHALCQGAVSFLSKPFRADELLRAVEEALSRRV
jgi:two-component system response regulator FixJ